MLSRVYYIIKSFATQMSLDVTTNVQGTYVGLFHSQPNETKRRIQECVNISYIKYFQLVFVFLILSDMYVSQHVKLHQMYVGSFLTVLGS